MPLLPAADMYLQRMKPLYSLLKAVSVSKGSKKILLHSTAQHCLLGHV